MDSHLVTPDRAEREHVEACTCGTPLLEDSHRICAGRAAVHHSARVEEQANELLARLRAIVLMGTLDGELTPLSV